MTPAPVHLETPRLVLREMTGADLPALRAILQDEETMVAYEGALDVVEIGYLFNREHWHRGYATEAARACRDHAFDTLGIERVWSQIRDTNIASMNVAIRVGMTVRGRFVKEYRGVTMPHLAFAIDRPGPP